MRQTSKTMYHRENPITNQRASPALAENIPSVSWYLRAVRKGSRD